MRDSLTSTKHFGVNARWLRSGLDAVAEERVVFRQDPEVASRLGLGTVQVEALGAWLRFAGLLVPSRGSSEAVLTSFGNLLYNRDRRLLDLGTWWALHWQLALNYVVWGSLAMLERGVHEIEDLDRNLRQLAEDASDHTIKNARRSLLSALRQTPIGTELGLVRLEESGRSVKKLEKLTVRRQAIPLAVFAYSVADWAREREVSSAPLERLAQPDAPGGIFHLSLGGLERSLMEVHGAFDGNVLTYSRTAGLDEAYFHFQHEPLTLLECYYRMRGTDALPAETLTAILGESAMPDHPPANQSGGEQ